MYNKRKQQTTAHDNDLLITSYETLAPRETLLFPPAKFLEASNATIKQTANQKALCGPDACPQYGERCDQDPTNDAAADRTIFML